MSGIRKFALNLAVGLATLSSSAHAMIEPFGSPITPTPKSQTQLVDGETDIAPIAFYRFCATNRDQCESASGSQKIQMSSEIWATLYMVNATINDRIVGDANKGAFDWSLTTTRGNCNDYAIQKRKALIQSGLPMSALSLAAVKTRSGEGHLVLTIRTTEGDFVLDNLRHAIVPWETTGYQWISVQSNSDPQHWVRIKSAAILAASNESKASNMTRFSDVI